MLLNGSPGGETDTQPAAATRSAMQPRGTPPLFKSPDFERDRATDRSSHDQACSSWRNGVGVLGGEGGFL